MSHNHGLSRFRRQMMYTEKKIVSAAKQENQTQKGNCVTNKKAVYLHKCVDVYCATFLSLTSSRNHVVGAEERNGKWENIFRNLLSGERQKEKLYHFGAEVSSSTRERRRGWVWESKQEREKVYCRKLNQQQQFLHERERKRRENKIGKMLPVRFLIDQIKMIRWSYNHVI